MPRVFGTRRRNLFPLITLQQAIPRKEPFLTRIVRAVSLRRAMCPPSASYLPFPTAGIFTATRNGTRKHVGPSGVRVRSRHRAMFHRLRILLTCFENDGSLRGHNLPARRLLGTLIVRWRLDSVRSAQVRLSPLRRPPHRQANVHEDCWRQILISVDLLPRRAFSM